MNDNKDLGILPALNRGREAVLSAQSSVLSPGQGLPHWFNVVAAAFGISALSPILALIWLLIRVDSAGPPLFRQWRVGLDGHRFLCYKFRTMTMTPASNRSLDGDQASLATSGFDRFVFSPKRRRDPRLSRIGPSLRRTSVDELPQLLNVVLGDMVLVGPRPELPAIVAQYPRRFPCGFHARHTVAPGISGLAQVRGRSDLTYTQSIAYDLEYVRRRSARFDLSILWRTAAVVARSAGAR